jgi:glutamine synthetase
MDMGVLTEKELDARHEIELHNYILKVQIESRVCADLAVNHLLPAAVTYQNRLLDNVRGLRDVLGSEAGKEAAAIQMELIQGISGHMGQLKVLSDAMTQARKKANVITDHRSKAIAYCDTVKPFLDKIRRHSNKLELLVDDEVWPLPKMRELLFTR